MINSCRIIPLRKIIDIHFIWGLFLFLLWITVLVTHSRHVHWNKLAWWFFFFFETHDFWEWHSCHLMSRMCQLAPKVDRGIPHFHTIGIQIIHCISPCSQWHKNDWGGGCGKLEVVKKSKCHRDAEGWKWQTSFKLLLPVSCSFFRRFLEPSMSRITVHWIYYDILHRRKRSYCCFFLIPCCLLPKSWMDSLCRSWSWIGRRHLCWYSRHYPTTHRKKKGQKRPHLTKN